MKFITSWFIKENKGFVWFWDRVGAIKVGCYEFDFAKQIRSFSILATITDFLGEIEKMLDFTSDFKVWK